MGTPNLATAALALAVGAAGFLVGRSQAPRTTPDDPGALAQENDGLRARVAELERTLASRPALAAAGRVVADAPGPAPSTPPATPARVADPAAPAPKVGPDGAPVLDLADVKSADELVARLLAYLETALARGPEGHLDLLRTLDATLKDAEKTFERVAGRDEGTAARMIYPLVRFAVLHEAQVADVTESVFRTMAEHPAALADLDKNTLEVFTEGLGVVMPGVVGTDRLARLRGYVETVLATPPGSQPKSIEGNRNRMTRLLRAWAPPMTVDEVIARLKRGDLPPEELAALVRRVPKDALAGLDVAGLLGPAIARGDMAAMGALRGVALPPGDLAALDRQVVAGPSARDGNFVYQYLWATSRGTWASAASFVEAWFASGAADGPQAAMIVRSLGAPAEAIRDLVARYRLSDEARRALEAGLPPR